MKYLLLISMFYVGCAKQTVQYSGSLGVRWQKLPIEIDLSSMSDDKIKSSVRNMMLEYNQKSNMQVFIEGAKVSMRKGKLDEGKQVVTSLKWVGENIVSAIITFDDSHLVNIDLDTVVRHELGHVIGLKHLGDSSDTNMSPYLKQNQKRQIDEWTLENIKCIYRN